MKKLLLLTCTFAALYGTTHYNEKIRLKKGSEIKISIPENKTTGYEWSLNIIENKKIVKMEAESKFKVQELIGAPGEYEIEIEAKKPGAATFETNYKRRWEKDPAEIRKYTIVVED